MVDQHRRLQVEPLEDRRMLAVITVNSLLDSLSVDGMVTLREAVQAANTDTSVDGSVRGNGRDRIVFDPALAGGRINIPSFSGEFEITQALTVDATPLSRGITIDAQENSRVFNFTAAVGNLTLAGLTIEGGLTTANNALGGDTSQSGAGIRFMSRGTLTLRNSTLAGNRTEGIRAGGGGIFTDDGAIVLESSTISGNRTTGFRAHGGGIHTVSGEVTIENSTITLNRTTGNDSDGGGLFVSNSSVNPALTIQNSIIAGNLVRGNNSVLPDLFPDPNIAPDIDFSLIGDTVGTGINFAAGTGNLVDMDPLLEPLNDNGGLSLTHAPQPTSPVIDKGDTSFVAAGLHDQRGGFFVREFGGRIDIGAVEAQTQTLVVDTTSDHSDGDFTSGNLSLREAIEIASASPNLDTSTPDLIEFDAALSGATLVLSDELLVTDGVTIDGSALAQPITIDGQHNTRLINFTAPDGSTSTGDLNIVGLTLTRGQTTQLDLPITIPAGGGAIRFVSSGTLTLTDSQITDSIADGPSFDGGAITTESGAVTLVDSTISGNFVTGGSGRGGGIHTLSGAVTLIDSTLTANSTNGIFGDGGGIYTESGDVTLTFSTLTNNHTTVEGHGGGIATNSGAVLLTRSFVSRNSTAGERDTGGGIYANSGSVTLNTSTMSGNTTTNENAPGGGIYSVFADVFVTDSTITHNSTSGFNSPGGGIRSLGADITLTRSTVSNNSTHGDFSHGGGLTTGGHLTLNDSTISGNFTAGDTSFGGGIHSTDTVRITNSTITNNSTSGTSSDGGGLFISAGGTPFFLLQNSIVAGNTVAQANSPDLRPEPGGNFDVDYNLIGNTSGSFITDVTGTGNLLNVSPLLGPLGSGGGPTQTHALLSGSPAIDAGDPANVFDPLVFDQRGAPNVRVVNGRIDMGAIEQVVNNNPSQADFDGDGDVDGDDYLLWEDGFGTSSGATKASGDADADGNADGGDFLTWQTEFSAPSASGGGSGQAVATVPATLHPKYAQQKPVQPRYAHPKAATAVDAVLRRLPRLSKRPVAPPSLTDLPDGFRHGAKESFRHLDALFSKWS